MYRRVRFPATGANPRKELSPASAGLFHAGPPRSAQPTERLGVGVVGLLCFGGTVRALYGQTQRWTHLAPLPCGGAFVCVRRVGTPTTETNAPARRLRGGLAGLARRGLVHHHLHLLWASDRQAYPPPSVGWRLLRIPSRSSAAKICQSSARLFRNVLRRGSFS